MVIENPLLEKIIAITGREAVLAGDKAAPFCTDWRDRYSGEAIAVVFPCDTHQVSTVVKLCVENNIAIVPQGGNTSLCGGSVPLNDGTQQIIINRSR